MNLRNEKKFLDTTRHIKMWFTKNPDKPFGYTINEERLIRHRKKHPHHRIEVVVDKSLMSKKGKKRLKEFSKKYSILTSDIADFESECNDLEKELLKWGEMEASSPGGNISVASDIYRYILIKHGIYSDFDVEIDFQGIPNKIPCDHFIINLREEWGWPGDRFDATLHSDSAFLAFPDPNHKVIQKMQEIINDYYLNRDFSKIVQFRNESEDYLKASVINNTGPGALDKALGLTYAGGYFSNLYRKNWMKNKLDQDPMDDEVNLNKSLLKDCVRIGYDNSWFPSGIERMEEEEKRRKDESMREEISWSEYRLFIK